MTEQSATDRHNYLATEFGLAIVLAARGRHPQAEAEARDCLTVRRDELGRDHPHTLATQDCLARIIAVQNRKTRR
ncbi:tetratricopeptide repeat protein [Actinomadura algeriensis]|uniref:Tetratricopeptide repeat protein n=1 Tax=Actinomadura algeriensis TaxID=1679523 RepID=A0ABR9JR69_9ACTN|nr:tetratricopeptide repeat protein [Actinomadura algeriensis]MBE1533074.1 hypothetical protein [Actinomadura algeriensis]